jgi:hypothetical protein
VWQELGIEKDDKDELLSKYRDQVAKFREKIDPETLKTIESEIKKISRCLPCDHPQTEYHTNRRYGNNAIMMLCWCGVVWCMCGVACTVSRGTPLNST